VLAAVDLAATFVGAAATLEASLGLDLARVLLVRLLGAAAASMNLVPVSHVLLLKR